MKLLKSFFVISCLVFSTGLFAEDTAQLDTTPPPMDGPLTPDRTPPLIMSSNTSAPNPVAGSLDATTDTSAQPAVTPTPPQTHRAPIAPGTPTPTQ